MKIRVLPSVDELVEVLIEHYDPGARVELARAEEVLEYVLRLLVDCGFQVSHEVEVDDKIVEQLEHALARPETWVRGRGRPKRNNPELHTKFK